MRRPDEPRTIVLGSRGVVAIGMVRGLEDSGTSASKALRTTVTGGPFQAQWGVWPMNRGRGGRAPLGQLRLRDSPAARHPALDRRRGDRR